MRTNTPLCPYKDTLKIKEVTLKAKDYALKLEHDTKKLGSNVIANQHVDTDLW